MDYGYIGMGIAIVLLIAALFAWERWAHRRAARTRAFRNAMRITMKDSSRNALTDSRERIVSRYDRSRYITSA